VSEAVAMRGKMPLHLKMLLAFVAGTIAGLVAQYFGAGGEAPWVEFITTWIAQPLGKLFLGLIFMLVLPLLFSVLVIGISEMGDVRALGRIGWRTLAYTVALSAIAVFIGLVLVNWIEPGKGVDPVQAQQLLSANAEAAQTHVTAAKSQPTGMALVLNIVPANVVKAAADNEILAVMFFAVMLGIGLVINRSPPAQALLRAIEGLFEVSMTLIGLVIRLAPYAVACLMFNLVAHLGIDVLQKLAVYVLVVVAALAIHLFVTYSIGIKLLARRSPVLFFRDASEAMLMAFSTASSNATLPTALRVADEKLRLPPKVSRFVLTVGATANQNGTALFEGITVIFLAQFFGVDLTLAQQATVMFVCILGGIGTAGVPAGSLPVVALICVMVGVPAEGLGIILGVNHFLDMCRTTVNVTGDLGIAAMVAGSETGADLPVEPMQAPAAG
jgi:DAACS family dicarboxylate/amino acid:cation (Na+ or H+) symporter